MTCDELEPLMEAYLDSQLDARAAGEVAAHLDDCAACATAFRAAQRASERLASALKVGDRTGALWSDIEQAVARHPLVRPRRSAWRRLAWSAVATVLVLAGVLLFRRSETPAGLVAALQRDHEEFLAGAFGPAFQGAPPAQMLAAANGRVDAAAFAAWPQVAAFKPEGGRLCHLSGVPVAWTLGHWNGQPVSWIVFSREELKHFPDVRDALLGGAPMVSQKTGRFHFAARAVGGHIVCALAEVPAAELETLLNAVPLPSHG